MLFREMIAAYGKIDIQHNIYCVDKNAEPLNFKRCGTFNNHDNFNAKNLFMRRFTTSVAS
jgi:hypothetical protein